ncbi:MAG: hypothetical protein ACJAX5_002263 [Patiriisocius sp.]|jgi:hypothetical protein
MEEPDNALEAVRFANKTKFFILRWKRMSKGKDKQKVNDRTKSQKTLKEKRKEKKAKQEAKR